MLFAGDLAICNRKEIRIEDRLQKLREYLEDASLVVKCKQLPLKESTTSKIKMRKYDRNEYTKLPTTNTFKYLRMQRDQEGGCEAEVTKRINTA